ncbi:HAMP domain-containing sensor histidine kinase [Paenibacillus cisolokensis]|uniref:sensor histidine kinase n=1 Tax=Paenibacillus cisolokensis TaxID=1658519 RepID=UPI003D2D9EF7
MKLRRRLAFHFTYQMIALSVLMLCVLLVLLFFLLKHINNEEMKRNFPAGVLEGIVAETITEDGVVRLAEYWNVLLKESDMWLQVVDTGGQVIHASNTNSDIPEQYSVSQLLEIQESGRLGGYTVNWEMDLAYEEPLLYLLGRVDEKADWLQSWFVRFQENGVVGPEGSVRLGEELARLGGFLHVINGEGEIVQAIGDRSAEKDSYHPLEIIAMQEQPGTYSTSITVYRDQRTGHTWLYHTPRENVANKVSVMQEVIWATVWLMICMLIISLAISFWNGYRYSRPLLLFTGWFERMGRGEYEEVLTPKDRKRVFRRNGKLRMRYKLYKEVIHAFYLMANRLAEAKEERERLDRNREEWMSGISHDLRTPLASIQGYGYMLENAPEEWSKEELREMGTVIREKGDYMLDLINDFSLVFRLKSRIAPQEMSPVDVNELVRRCVLKYVNDATWSKASYTFSGGEGELPVNGNANWLQRLMDNLITNAVKHNPDGIEVEVRVEKRPGWVAITVADQGVGMDEETMANLFERYYRGTNTEESMEGSGLGMSIAKAIVEAHQGQVEVWSEPGRGTAITVLLPEMGDRAWDGADEAAATGLRRS